MAKKSADYAYQAFRILYFGFIILPIIAGLDKFANILVNWSHYLSPFALKIIGDNAKLLMPVVGVIEIIAGVGVLFKPKIFAYIISVWLLLIIINLLQIPMYDIALRDFGLLLASLALGSLCHKYH